MDEIVAVMPMIFDALSSCTYIDPKTGKKHVKIVPETTTEMAALYRAQAQFVAAQTRYGGHHRNDCVVWIPLYAIEYNDIIVQSAQRR